MGLKKIAAGAMAGTETRFRKRVFATLIIVLAVVSTTAAFAQQARNDVSVTAPVGLTETNAANNTASDTDPINRQLTVRKALLPAADPGQFVMNANGTPGPESGNGAQAVNLTVQSGQTVTFAETAGTGTVLANYSSSYRCVSVDGVGAEIAEIETGTATSGDITMPAANVVCTITNTRIAQQFSVNKAWGAGSATGHTASVTTTGGAAQASFNSTAPTATTGTAVTVNAGDQITLPTETFGGGANGLYTTTVGCTGGSPLAAGTAVPVNLTIQDNTTATVCTYTNTPIAATLQLAKDWAPGTPTNGDVLTIGATTGGTSSGAASNTVSFNATAGTPANSGAPVNVTAGNVITLPAETGVNLAGYTTEVGCTGGHTLSGTNGQVTNTLTLTSGNAAVCTYTNTPVVVPPSLQLAKHWAVGSLAGHSVTIGATSGGTNQTVSFNATSPSAASSGAPVSVGVGAVVTLPAETGADVDKYTTTIACTGGHTLSGNDGQVATNTLTFTSANNAVCTYTNTPRTQQLSLNKAWGAGSITNHTASATTSGGSDAGVDSNPTFTSTAPTNTIGSPATVTVGNVVTLPAEAFGGGATQAMYTSTVECTGGSPLAQTTLPAQLTIATSASDTVCTYTNIARPRLTLAKTVINDNGGPAVDTDFTLTATGPTPGVTGVEGDAAITNAVVSAGVYALSESGGPTGYTASTYSCVVDGGPPAVSNSLTLADGQSAVCTITNDDQAASLTLTKAVTNDNGGTAVDTDFTLSAAGPTPVTGVEGDAAITAAAVSAGTYTLSESNLPGYTAGSWSCTGGSLAGDQLTLAGGETASCEIVNDDQAASLTLTKAVTNDNGGTAVDTDFTLSAAGPTPITGVEGDAAITAAAVSAGTYTLSESNLPGYAAGSWSCTGGSLAGDQLTLAGGETASCEIVNDDLATPGLSIAKSQTTNADEDGSGSITAGDTLTYVVTATNTGDVALTNVVVSDSKITPATTSCATVAPGATCILTGTYQVTAADATAGEVVNTATADSDETPPVTTTVTVPVSNPGLSIAKSQTANADEDGSGSITAGDTLTYVVTATNTGDVALTNVVVSDSKITPATTSCATVAPGATCVLTGTYQVTAADAAAGEVVNTATADSDETPPVTTTVTVPVSNPGLSIAKSQTTNADEDGSGTITAGDTLTYVVTATNTGDVALTNVVVSDSKITPATTSCATVAPGATCVLTGTYQVTAADATAGEVVNTATADSTETPPVTTTVTTPVVPSPADIEIKKRAGVRLASRGDIIPYTIEVTNRGDTAVGPVNVDDVLPVGFIYVDGSAAIDGTPVDPTVSGRRLTFAGLTIPGGAKVVITLQVKVGGSVAPGDHVNVAVVTTPGGVPLTPEAPATVRIRTEHVFDCGEIIGKVFDDRNRNGYQDEEVGEPGLPGVRLVTVRGVLITTDRYGRFNVPCADIPDAQIGSNFILKLDTRTLPTGYRLTTENPRVVRLTRGKLTKLNFGAAIDKVVRIDLNAAAFEQGRSEPGEKLKQGLRDLIPVLNQEHSVVRLTYYASNAKDEGAKSRLQAVAKWLREEWGDAGGSYELGIETKVVQK